jgi:hypothetical protein
MDRTAKLEEALRELLINLEEDVSSDIWSRHLHEAVLDAYALLNESEETDAGKSV